MFNKNASPRLRRKSDGLVRWRMCCAAAASGFINIAAFLLLIPFDILGRIPGQLQDPNKLYDSVVVFLFVVLTTIVFLLILYTWKVKILLRDIQRLSAVREREHQEKNRSQKLEALGLLAAGISHEINSCLQSILGSCEMAKNRITETDQCLLFIQRAIDNSLHARRVVSKVLTFSSSGGSTDMVPQDLKTLLDEAVTYSTTFLPKAVQVTVHMEIPEPVVMTERVGFVEIMTNLINNAAHAMNQQGIIRIRVGRNDVVAGDQEFEGLAPGAYASIKVIDTGCGISPENLGRIFDPFFTTKPTGEGTGLGLSMVHGLVKGMNGLITVRSIVDAGTEFTVYVPLYQQKERSNEAHG